MKKVLSYFVFTALALLAVFMGCKKEVPELIEQIESVYIVDISEETDWDFMIAAKDGSMVLFNVDENTEIPTQLVFKKNKNSDEGLSVFFNEKGFPETVVVGNHILFLGNFRDNLFDLALINPDKSIEYFYDIDAQIDWDQLYILDNSIVTRLSFKDFRKSIKDLGKVLTVVTCIAIPITGVAGVAACTSLALDVVAEVVDVPALSDIAGGVATAIGCATSMGITCILGAVESATDVIHYGNEYVEALFPQINEANGVINGGGYTPSPNLSVSTISLILKAAGESKTFNISTGQAWTITGAPSWATVSATSGTGNTTITVTAEENKTTSKRKAELIITVTGATPVKVTISQDEADGGGDIVWPTYLFFTADGETKTFTITTGGEWNITGVPSWATISATSGTGNTTITIIAEENKSTSIRNEELIITVSGATPVIVTLIQAVYGATTSLSISRKNLIFSANDRFPGTFTITTGKAWNITGAPSWATVSETSGTGNTTITVIAEENKSTSIRKAELIITESGSMPDKVTLIQAAAGDMTYSDLVDPKYLSFSAKGETKGITMSTNRRAWTITGAPSWATVSETSGTGTDIINSIKVTASENTTTTLRTAELIIIIAGFTPYKVNLYQEAATFVDPNSFSLSEENGIASSRAGGQVSITVNAPSGMRWTTSIGSTGVGWLFVLPASGTGSSPVDIIILPNNGGSRAATITFSASGSSKTLTVIQQ